MRIPPFSTAVTKQSCSVEVKSKDEKIVVYLLVSTYVVCERLSVMHEPAGVVEILVQNPQNTPYSEVQFQNNPPPQNENCQRVQI